MDAIIANFRTNVVSFGCLGKLRKKPFSIWWAERLLWMLAMRPQQESYVCGQVVLVPAGCTRWHVPGGDNILIGLGPVFQGRQKLARLNTREFATLIVDILSEAKRRHLGHSGE